MQYSLYCFFLIMISCRLLIKNAICCLFCTSGFLLSPFFREMALEGLHLLKDQDQVPGGKSDVKYPELGNMLDYISMQQPQTLEPTKLREEKILFPSKTYMAMIRFLMDCFEHDHAIVDFEGGINESGSPVVTMCLLLEHALALEGSAELQSISSKALVEIGSRLPQVISFLSLQIVFLSCKLDYVIDPSIICFAAVCSSTLC